MKNAASGQTYCNENDQANYETETYNFFSDNTKYTPFHSRHGDCVYEAECVKRGYTAYTLRPWRQVAAAADVTRYPGRFVRKTTRLFFVSVSVPSLAWMLQVSTV